MRKTNLTAYVRSNRSRGARGFTLLEMIIAVAIAVLILAMTFTILNGATLAQSASRSRIEASESARILFQAIEHDLAGAFPGPLGHSKALLVRTVVPQAAWDGNPGFHGQTLHFATASDNRTQGAEFVTVRYFMARRTAQEEKRLYRQVNANGDFPSDPDLLTLNNEDVLLTQVKRLEIGYARWDPAEKTYLTWDGAQWVNPISGLGSAGTLSQATHLDLNVTLGIDQLDERFTKTQRTSQFVWNFRKRVPIPAAFPN
ncbi:MAG: prepilin-type N-terminal cleavage/methylation domain-containing protein [Planctomycetota bacterium]|nr:prepilin-type N-terminal cleavage/methylation domain-containing protein [Planctomycetota bacterium]